MTRHLLGLDAGNTVVKAVLFDLAGRELAVAARDGRSHRPRPGHVERDLGELWDNARLVIRAVIEEAAVDPASIAAVGCAGHGNGLYALDRAGAPLIAIQSLDTRATDLVEAWRGEDVGERTRPICLQRPWPSQTPTLLAHLARHDPDLYRRIGTVFLCKDFVVNRLTGARVSDVSDLAGAGLIAFPGRRTDRALMEAYGLGDAFGLLPPALESTDLAGRVTAEAAAATGLAEGTPVVAGLFDIVASALGSGVRRTGAASIICGTWSINQVVTDEPVRDPSIFMVSTFDRSRHLAVESSATSAANLEWLVREVLHEEEHGDVSPFAAAGALVAGVAADEDLPIFHPFLYGAREDGRARAGFYGVAGWHGRAHLLRALFEGVVFEHRRHVERLRGAGAVVDEVVLAGGGSRSLVWPQIFADVLGVPVTVARGRETGALGAAIAAGTGVGLFPDLAAGAAAMTAPERHYRPDPAAAAPLARRFRLYCDIAERMAPVWKAMAEGAGRC